MLTPSLTNSIASLCFKAQGDIGPLTTYTNKNGIVVFLKAWLRDPASRKQINHRNKMRCAAWCWKHETKCTRRNWERASQIGNTKLNGYNLYVCWHMRDDVTPFIRTLERQTEIKLLDEWDRPYNPPACGGPNPPPPTLPANCACDDLFPPV